MVRHPPVEISEETGDLEPAAAWPMGVPIPRLPGTVDPPPIVASTHEDNETRRHENPNPDPCSLPTWT
jgi:hypothetical protein